MEPPIRGVTPRPVAVDKDVDWVFLTKEEVIDLLKTLKGVQRKLQKVIEK